MFVMRAPWILTWKGDYVEIFLLLPLEVFNLDKVKLDESKKEEEKLRYRLILCAFGNWSQAFHILHHITVRPNFGISIPLVRPRGLQGGLRGFAMLSSTGNGRRGDHRCDMITKTLVCG